MNTIFLKDLKINHERLEDPLSIYFDECNIQYNNLIERVYLSESDYILNESIGDVITTVFKKIKEFILAIIDFFKKIIGRIISFINSKVTHYDKYKKSYYITVLNAIKAIAIGSNVYYIIKRLNAKTNNCKSFNNETINLTKEVDAQFNSLVKHYDERSKISSKRISSKEFDDALDNEIAEYEKNREELNEKNKGFVERWKNILSKKITSIRDFVNDETSSGSLNHSEKTQPTKEDESKLKKSKDDLISAEDTTWGLYDQRLKIVEETKKLIEEKDNLLVKDMDSIQSMLNMVKESKLPESEKQKRIKYIQSILVNTKNEYNETIKRYSEKLSFDLKMLEQLKQMLNDTVVEF